MSLSLSSSGLCYEDAGHGYDIFGLNPGWVERAMTVFGPLYDHYFRVQSEGIHHLPREGPAILAANHGGVLPFDGMMLWMDVLRRTQPRRVARPVADHFVPRLPFVSVLFARCGVVGGSRGNVHALLERGEVLLIFPEGTPGIGKPLRERYHLKEFRVGHAEMAIRHRAPVVPVAIIGPEEQLPLVVRLPVSAFGAPYLPLSLLPLPLPVRYHIYYGQPIPLHEEHRPEEADDPQVVATAAARVRAAVQALVEEGLRARTGVFR
jgi:1-acyl-sn-glycerol-3-phosphate acyltransferase